MVCVGFNLTNMKINPDLIGDILQEVANKVSLDLVQDLKETAPVDTTTKAQAEYLYKQTGLRAWIKDSVSSRDYWAVNRVSRSSFGGGIRCSIVNKNPAVISLALGFIFSPLNVGKTPVERTQDGKYSIQDPKGMYALNSMKRSFAKNGIKYISINK